MIAERFELSDTDLVRLAVRAEGTRRGEQCAGTLKELEHVPERRSAPRFPYPDVVLVAPCDGKNLPDLQAMKLFRGNDISAGGISFFTDVLPDYEYLILAIRLGTELNWVKARVVRDTLDRTNGRPRYLIGCEFIARLLPED